MKKLLFILVLSAVLWSVGIVEAQEMPTRFYLLPMEVGENYREIAYFQTRYGSGTLPSSYLLGFRDYGLMPWALATAEMPEADHAWLVTQLDVTVFPENLSSTVSAAALTTVQAKLEALNIPADWVNTSTTYRELLRVINGLFSLSGRHRVKWDETLIDNPSQLDLQWNQIPLARRQRMLETANEFDIDTSGFTGTMLVRQILKGLADQWADQPIKHETP